MLFVKMFGNSIFCDLLEIMSLVEIIAKQAQATFSKSLAEESFTENLSKLIRNVTQVRSSDLKLNKDTIRAISAKSSTTSPPVTYIEIVENQSFSMGIFLLHSFSSRIPLHDHPGMHGVLKVIKGTIKITSYSAVSKAADVTLPQDIKNRVKKSQKDLLIPVEKHSSKTVTLKDEPCVLRPTEGNFHEICAVGGQAAFLDVLAPPYDLEERDCHYYTILETDKPDSEIKTWLLRTPAPEEFWFDTAPYTGPKVKL